MAENLAKISFSYQRDAEIVNSQEFSEKGRLTFTEKGIYMGLGSGRSLKYPNFIQEDYYKKVNIDKLLSVKVDSELVYAKDEVDTKLMDLKTNGFVDLSNYYNKQQVDVRLETYVTKDSTTRNVRYLGSVDSFEALERRKNSKVGDMITVLSTKDNYVFSGDEWIKMMGIVDLSEYYTRAEINAKLDEKANKEESYIKDEIDAKLDEKANVSDLEEKLELKLDASKILNYYDKAEIKEKLDLKLDAADSMSKEELENGLNLKADKADTYTKEKVDGFIEAKADKDNTYTKTEIVDLLAEKAHKDLTYTKLETDYQITNYQIPELAIGDPYIKDKLYSTTIEEEKFYFLSTRDGSAFGGDIFNNPYYMVFCSYDNLKVKVDRAIVYTKAEVDELIREAVNSSFQGSGSSSTVNTSKPTGNKKPAGSTGPGPVQVVPSKPKPPLDTEETEVSTEGAPSVDSSTSAPDTGENSGSGGEKVEELDKDAGSTSPDETASTVSPDVSTTSPDTSTQVPDTESESESQDPVPEAQDSEAKEENI